MSALIILRKDIIETAAKREQNVQGKEQNSNKNEKSCFLADKPKMQPKNKVLSIKKHN